MTALAGRLHEEALCLDAAAPRVTPRGLRGILDDLSAGGIDAVLATVASIESCRETRRPSGAGQRSIARGRRARLATTAAKIRQSRQDGDLAVVLHLQGRNPIEDNIDLVEVFHRWAFASCS